MTARAHAFATPDVPFIEAAMNYTSTDGPPPVAWLDRSGGTRRDQTPNPVVVPVYDGRAAPQRFVLDHEGFELRRSTVPVVDPADTAAIEAVHYTAAVELVKSATGAEEVVVFDHTLRVGRGGAPADARGRQPSTVVHNDYTERSGPQRLRDLMPPERIDALLSRRFSIVNVWRPLAGPVLSAPLAFADAQSVSPEDLIATDLRYEDRIGEIYQVAHAPQHRWWYFPQMTLDEAVLIKCHDSARDGRARFTPHAAFDDPTTPANAPPRRSIELRTIAFF